MSLFLIGGGMIFASLFVGMATFLAAMSMPIIPKSIDAVFKASICGVAVGAFVILVATIKWAVS